MTAPPNDEWGRIDPEALFAQAESRPVEPWEPPAPEELEIPGYRVERLAGRGGMGAVYQATQLSLQRPVAIKLLPAALAPDVVARERFEREARLLATLRHPHILPVIDFGELPTGMMFLVTEWADGGDLQQQLSNGVPRAETVVRWLGEAASALDAAHAAGVIHRDLKPANLLLDANGRVRLGDFGIAFASSDPRGPMTRLTLTGLSPGTPDYMAPELLEGASAGPQTDGYALGVVAYQLLTGKLPRGAFAPASTLSGVPRRVDAVLIRALASAPSQRWETAGEFAEALRRASMARQRVPLWVVGLGAAAVLMIGSWLLWQQRPMPPETSEPPVVTALPAAIPLPAPITEPTPEPTPVAVESAPVPSSPGLAVGSLLGEVQLPGDILDGEWSREGASLVSGSTRSIVAVPVRPGATYRVTLRFTRLSGEHSVALLLPTASGPCSVELDAWDWNFFAPIGNGFLRV